MKKTTNTRNSNTRSTLKFTCLFGLLGPVVGVGACDTQDEDVDLSDESAMEAAPVEISPDEYEEFNPQDADAETRDIAELTTRVSVAEGVTMPPSARAEAEELQLRFANSLIVAKGSAYFSARSADEEVVEITYRGVGESRNASDDKLLDGEDEGVPLEDIDMPEKYSDGARWIIGFNPATGSEFEVRIPAEFAEMVGDDAERRRLTRGSQGSDKGGQTEPEGRGLNGDNDNRTMKGSLNTRHSYSRWRRQVNFVSIGAGAGANSKCSGALVGRHHVVTAAHCIYQRAVDGNPAFWINRELRVGRNGSDWWDDASMATGWRWFWVEAPYLTAANAGGSPKEWDIGLVIFPDRHIGSGTGWMGWYYSNTSHDDMGNRSYPHCSSSNPPSNCQPGHMYGPTASCNTGYFSSAKDSYGYSLFGYHACDTSSSQSGSALYRDTQNHVRGVHKGLRHHTNAGSSDTDPNNSFALITRDRSNVISYFRSLYP